MKFLRKVFITFTVLSLTIACSTSKKNRFGGGYNGNNELADNVPNYVLFDVDSAKLDQQYLSTLDKQATWLKSNSDVSVVVEGHCDERGTREYNLALGAKRANAVKSYLLSSSVDSSKVATISYGKERPVVQGTGPDVWRENRRAITLIN